ncbi:MAG: hypothetical protein ACRDQD_00510 [Nocardioidaceae bacterium]
MNGLLVEVIEDTRGSQATAVAAVGAGQVLVEDLTPFPETGGIVDILGEQYTYTGVAPDPETIDPDTLEPVTSGAVVLGDVLAVQVDIDDPVWLVLGGAPATDAYAVVEFPAPTDMDQPDDIAAVHVPIDYSQRPMFTPGPYDPAVPIEVSTDLTRVITVPGVKPTIDGSTIVDLPGVVPDGLPPSSSPAAVVRPGIGLLEVRWTPVANADPVTYAVYVEVAVPVEDPETGEIASYVDMTPGPTNLVAEDLVGSITYVRTLQGGTAVQADMVYAVRIIASDADGSAAPGAQAVASPAQITSPDIAADSILGNHISGGTITGRELAGEIVLGSKITTGGLDSEGNTVGQRVDLDADGLRVISPSGTELVNLPTDPAKSNTFDGDVTARTLLITGGTSFQSPYNEITSDSGLTLAAGVSNPSGKPGLVIGYDTITLQQVSRAGQSGSTMGTFALNPGNVTCICPTTDANIFWVVERRSNGSRIWRYNLTTGLNVQDSGGAYVWDYGDWRITGMAILDDGQDVWIGEWSGNNKWYLNRSLHSPPLNIYDTRVGVAGSWPTVVTNGTDWFIMESRTGANLGQAIVRRIGWNSTNFGEVPKVQDITLGAGTGSTIGTHISGGRVGAMDLGGTRVAYLFQSAGTDVRVTNHSSGATRDSSLEWPSGMVSSQRGFMWHPATSAWYALDASGTLIKYTSQTLSGGTHWHIANSIYDSDAAGTGTHETLIGPKATVAMRKRALLRVSIPTVPVAGGGTDDPDKYRLYAAQNSSATPPASTAFRFQAEGTTPTTGPGSATLTTLATATAAPPATNNFPDATPAYARSIAEDGNGYLAGFEGDGEWRWHPLGQTATLERTTAQSIATPSTFTTVTGLASKSGFVSHTVFGSLSGGTLTITRAGHYMINGQAIFATNATGNRRIAALFLNGSEARRGTDRPGDVPTPSFVRACRLSVGDTVELRVWQDTAGALNVNSAELQLSYLGPWV